jgi:hypothetical protein
MVGPHYFLIFQFLYRNTIIKDAKTMTTSTILIGSIVILICVIIFQFFILYKIFQWIHFINLAMSEMSKIMINNVSSVSEISKSNCALNEFLKKEINKPPDVTIN